MFNGTSQPMQNQPYILVRDEKAANTAGGTFTAAAWRDRVLNVERVDTHSIATLASNQVTIPAGTYRYRYRAPAMVTVHHKGRLYNHTAGAEIAGSISEAHRDGAGGDSGLTVSEGSGRFTIAVASAIGVQHWCTTTRATDGFGPATNIDSKVEVFASLELWKEF